MLHVHFNAGSCGDVDSSNPNSQSTANTYVRAKIINRCYSIADETSRPPDTMSLVEAMTYSFSPSPFWGLPAATNREQEIVNAANDCLKRKVCMYGTVDQVFVFSYENTSIEGVTTIHSFPCQSKVGSNAPNTLRKIGIIVIYRNINKNSVQGPATPQQIRNYIDTHMKNLRQHPYNVRQVLVIGDFNISAKLSLLSIGLNEIFDERLAHKHNASSRKTYIDKVYTNMSDVVIKAVMDPVENYVNPSWGHKTILIQIGQFTGQRTSTRLTLSLRKWRLFCKAWVHRTIPSVTELIGNKEAIDEAANTIIERLVRNKKSCMVTRNGNSNKTILQKIEELDHESFKSPEASKALKHFHQAFKADVERGESRPPAAELIKKGQLKLNNLAQANPLVVERVALQLHQDANPVTPIFPSKAVFKKLVTSLKNSNASDYYGLTTKLIKIWVSHSSGGFEDIYALAYASAATGYYPVWLRIDLIHFIFKRKGCKMDPLNYRPITLCPALSKIFDKITSTQLKKLMDYCINNHAYVEFLSCQSALIDVAEFFNAQRRICTNADFIYIPIVLCEDIAGAFESIDIDALIFIFSILFRQVTEFQIVQWIKSYFERTSFVKEGDAEFELIRIFLNKTSPQGSILSPAFWRFYEALISKRYSDRLQALSEELDYVRSINLTSFADDKKTQAVLMFKKTETAENIKIKIAEFALKCRSLLSTSCQELGCRIAIKKSEVVLPVDWQIAEIKSKIEYVWLGYSLRILANMYISITATRMNQRFESTRKITRDMYQYMESIYARWKIYKIFVNPVIEWFLPVMLTARMDSLAVKNKIEVFQMDALCDALKVPRTVNRIKLEKLVCEKPVRIKMMIMATRLSKHVDRHISQLTARNNSPVATRSGLNLNKYPSANHKDIGDRLMIFADTHKHLPKQTSDFYKKKFYFDVNKITKTTKAWSKAISKHADRTGRTRRVTL